MPCYRPYTAYQPLGGGALQFKEGKDCRTVTVRCGNCIGCRIERQQGWAVRCLAESQMWPENCFLTLTYNEQHFPMHGSLCYDHFQLFMKRLRKQAAKEGKGPVRFFMCGEYGENLGRPHYHALLFNYNFDDRVKSNSVYSRSTVYESEMLNRIWGKGFATIGEVTYASAQYCASYVLKRHAVTGPDDDFYRRCDPATGEIYELEPEFARMSLKPGIGAAWLERYWRDLYLTGHAAVIINGSKKKIPRYFSDAMQKIDPILMENFGWEQEKKALERADDYTPERLRDREECARAALKLAEERKRS